MFVTYRQLTGKDAGAYKALRLFAVAESPMRVPSTVEVEENTPETVFEQRLMRSIAIGAFAGENLVGTTLLEPVAHKGTPYGHKLELKAVYAKPEYRGQGVARCMWKEALPLITGNYTQILTEIVAGNKEALQFYTSLGFEIYGEEKRGFFYENEYFTVTKLIKHL